MSHEVAGTKKCSGVDRPKNTAATAAPVAAALLIAQQFSSRCLTFIANQILLRYLSPELLGASTQLELYATTVFFFSRESLRVALQRQTGAADDGAIVAPRTPPPGHVDAESSPGRTQAVVNLAYLSVVLGVVASVGVGWLALARLNAAPATIPAFRVSLILYGVAAGVELLTEPCYVVVQQRSRLDLRALSESGATCARCLATCGVCVVGWHAGAHWGVLPFAVGQLTYAAVLLIVYYWNVLALSRQVGFSLVPKPIYASDAGTERFAWAYFSRPILRLGRSFFVQSIFKHALTQGDTIIISLLTSPHVQGVYALANNYGSLVARLILQPVEDVSRNYFGRVLASRTRLTPTAVATAHTSLLHLIRLYLIISIWVIAVGPTAAPVLLTIVAGPRWVESGAGDVLATFCCYIPLLAINGLTEAFVSCATSEAEVHRQTAWMVAFSAAFAGSAVLFLRTWDLGPQGLVYANSLNMILRVIWATTFIRSYLARWKIAVGFETLLPRLETVAAGVGAFGILRQLEKDFEGHLLDAVKTGGVACLLLLIICIAERKHLIECYTRLVRSTDEVE
ncbi:hypothetical protein K3495_g1600 [Podosphaera aphanis]|nr:hypothetical protein K3495_g1600 [Podosphaera aphanis]